MKEREDRIKYHDDKLNPIRGQIKDINEGLVKEKKTRDKVKEESRVIKSKKENRRIELFLK